MDLGSTPLTMTGFLEFFENLVMGYGLADHNGLVVIASVVQRSNLTMCSMVIHGEIASSLSFDSASLRSGCAPRNDNFSYVYPFSPTTVMLRIPPELL